MLFSSCGEDVSVTKGTRSHFLCFAVFLWHQHLLIKFNLNSSLLGGGEFSVVNPSKIQIIQLLCELYRGPEQTLRLFSLEQDWKRSQRWNFALCRTFCVTGGSPTQLMGSKSLLEYHDVNQGTSRGTYTLTFESLLVLFGSNQIMMSKYVLT